MLWRFRTGSVPTGGGDSGRRRCRDLMLPMASHYMISRWLHGVVYYAFRDAGLRDADSVFFSRRRHVSALRYAGHCQKMPHIDKISPAMRD